ncbi:hypothetical protein WA538_004821, partial [Blastocystis sp. DL]
MLAIRSLISAHVRHSIGASQRLVQIGKDTYCYVHLVPSTQKRELQTTPPKQGIIGAIFLIGGLSWSYSYLKRESYIRRGMMPPPSTGLLGATLKTFLFAATLPITFPYFIYKMVKGELNMDPYGSRGGPYTNTQNSQETSREYSRTENPGGYGRRMVWSYIPGIGWRYVEMDYDSNGNTQTNGDANYHNFYQDFEDFFQNSYQYQQQQQQQQQQQSWNYDDIFGNRSGMSRQEAYKVLGLQPNATKQEINLAHKKMLMKYHPDHGGSTEMASKINQARDVLLGKN